MQVGVGSAPAGGPGLPLLLFSLARSSPTVSGRRPNMRPAGADQCTDVHNADTVVALGLEWLAQPSGTTCPGADQGSEE
jgi:hypothetical protein